MKKELNQSKTEKKYQLFENLNKVFCYLVFAAGLIFGVLSIFAITDYYKALFGAIISIILIFVIALIITKKRSEYLRLIKDERTSITQTGIFREIYDAYHNEELEKNLACDRLLFNEYYNGVDIGVLKNKHEFLIEIDEKSISIIVDEETDNPIDTEIPLTDISSVEQMYTLINDFINTHS